jgi:hypothetical protein
MDEGLREAISLAVADAKRPLALEHLINVVRHAHAVVRQLQSDPACAKQVKQFTKLGRDAGRHAAKYLRPGGELRNGINSQRPNAWRGYAALHSLYGAAQLDILR